MKIGEWQTLQIDRETSIGLFLVDEEGQEVLLPMKWIPEDQEDDTIRVFVHRDGDDRLIATTLHPHIEAYQYGSLRVKAVNKVGAWLDWGIEKDLLVPFAEQFYPMKEGEWHVVYAFVDEKSDRLIASSRVTQFFIRHDVQLDPQQEVDCIAHKKTDLGIHAVINNRYGGLVHRSDLHRPIRVGETFKAYVFNVREDGKVDLRLRREGHKALAGDAKRIVDALAKNNGFLPLHDKSDPEVIKEKLGMSKKSFKKIIGGLYKSRQIEIRPDGIYLV